MFDRYAATAHIEAIDNEPEERTMKSYTPRRQSKRWLDADCPRGVLAIYAGGNTYSHIKETTDA